MSKALFLGLPLHGHTNPSLPLVRALVERGEEVIYFSNAAFAARIEDTGATYRPYRNAFLADLTNWPQQTHEISWLLMRTTAEVLARELDVFRAEKPDYLIVDSVAPWGQWTGQVLGLPVVTSITTFAVNRHVLAQAGARGTRPKSLRLTLSKLRQLARAAWLRRKVRREYRVKGTGLMGMIFGHSDLNIVYTSRDFQPCAGTFDDRFQFIGPTIGDRPETSDLTWDEPSPSDLVYVSLGTIFNADPVFYRNCFEAFRGEKVRVIMSVGRSVDPASLGTPPDNVVVRAHVPQLEVLRRASAFVSHGGMNSVSESLYFGVPLVCVPQMGEQEIVARQVEALGAGVHLAKDEATADRIRELVARLLNDGSFRTQAATLRRSFETSGGASRGAEAILAFTRSRAAGAVRTSVV